MDITKTETKSLEQWTTESKAITRQATDIMASPTVKEGYALGGYPSRLAYVHLQTMALKRLKKWFPCFDARDPVMARLLAEAKLIVAKCILLKYQTREKRMTYDHLEDITNQINKLVRDKYLQYKTVVGKLS